MNAFCGKSGPGSPTRWLTRRGYRGSQDRVPRQVQGRHQLPGPKRALACHRSRRSKPPDGRNVRFSRHGVFFETELKPRILVGIYRGASNHIRCCEVDFVHRQYERSQDLLLIAGLGVARQRIASQATTQIAADSEDPNPCKANQCFYSQNIYRSPGQIGAS